MKINEKIVVTLSFCLTLIVLFIGFFHQFEVEYSDCVKIEPVDGCGEAFYPDAYIVFHTEEAFLNSPYYRYHGDEIMKATNMNYDKYSYVIVEGAKVKRMYYSIKSTLLDDKSPDYDKARRYWKLCLFIEYQTPDGYRYIYQIDKNTRLRGFVE